LGEVVTGFRHVVLFQWRPNVPGGVVQEARRAIEDFALAMRDLCSVWIAEDVGENPPNFDMVVVADFADASGYQVYANHPLHLALLEQHIRPILAARAAVQARVI
jgi:hypothetical protein